MLAVTQGLPPLNDAVELVALPPWLQVQLLLAAAGDLLATTAIERVRPRPTSLPEMRPAMPSRPDVMPCRMSLSARGAPASII